MSVLQRTRGARRGSVLIVALLSIFVMSALAAAIAAFSGIHLQIGTNQQKLNNARACAESGIEVLRYWMDKNKIIFSGTTEPGDRLAVTAARLQDALTAAGITNIVPVWNATTITVSNVPLNSRRRQSFSAVFTQIDDLTMRVEVTGRSGGVSRTLVSNFRFDHRVNSIFDHALGTKGPMLLSGGVDLLGLTVESNAYIDTDTATALTLMGKAYIHGEVKLTGSQSHNIVVVEGGHAGIGGVYGHAAEIPPASQFEQPKLEFPEMDPSYFEPYVDPTHTLDPSMDTSGTLVLDNIRIPANMNPSFTGQVTLRGVVYIEAPNVVTFAGSTIVCGVIVGDGDPADHSGTNSITFTGNLESYPMTDTTHLPLEPQFDGIRQELGTFLMAPGFKADFEGPFTTVSGAIGANGIKFGGSSGGTIHGSLINYSPTLLECSGSGDITFENTDGEVPAGFKQQVIVTYDPSSYSEAMP